MHHEGGPVSPEARWATFRRERQRRHIQIILMAGGAALAVLLLDEVVQRRGALTPYLARARNFWSETVGAPGAKEFWQQLDSSRDKLGEIGVLEFGSSGPRLWFRVDARWSELAAEDRSEFCRRMGAAWRLVTGPSAVLEVEDGDSGKVLARFAARHGGQAGSVEVPE